MAAICDRRGGIGADGVLRVLRGDIDGGAEWFMDYRNADGTVSQMCGNGVRVFARYLQEAGLVKPAETGDRLAVDTRDGIKQVTYCDDGEISVDMGAPKLGGPADVSVSGRHLLGLSVDMGNPHVVVTVDDLRSAGELAAAPITCAEQFPAGVNVEFVRVVGDRHAEMRIFERGVGETWSCGTGACAVAAVLGSGDVADAGADGELGRHRGSSPSATDSAVTNGPAELPSITPTTYAVTAPGAR